MTDSAQSPPVQPLLLLILDGFGCADPSPDNAISQAHAPHWQELWENHPHALINTSGPAVGLPEGQMGNSEVGHMNIGAGRIVYQDFTRISQAIETGEFKQNTALRRLIGQLQESGGSLHVMGLLSPGGVHSHEEHIFAMIRMAGGRVPIVVHAFLDGRDTPPRSAEASIRRLQSLLDGTQDARLATISGRYYAMDRDQRWDRVEKAWRAIVRSDATHQADSGLGALNAAYERGENDEFVVPTVVGSANPVEDGDGMVFCNFRADRARQLSRALTGDDFDGFRADMPELAGFVAFTNYDENLNLDVAFPPARLDHGLGETLAEQGLSQLRIAETEKYAHVTFFFNGGKEQLLPGEDRKLIPSPQVATYDLQPEMSAPALADALVEAIVSGQYALIVCNVANPDMVGHTGNFSAAVKAVEAVDVLIGQVLEALDRAGGELLLTADHGNVEQMEDASSGQAHTAHTSNPVPAVFRGRDAEMKSTGSLRDIAPTVLTLLGLDVPEAMTGESLVRLSG